MPPFTPWYNYGNLICAVLACDQVVYGLSDPSPHMEVLFHHDSRDLMNLLKYKTTLIDFKLPLMPAGLRLVG